MVWDKDSLIHIINEDENFLGKILLILYTNGKFIDAHKTFGAKIAECYRIKKYLTKGQARWFRDVNKNGQHRMTPYMSWLVDHLNTHREKDFASNVTDSNNRADIDLDDFDPDDPFAQAAAELQSEAKISASGSRQIEKTLAKHKTPLGRLASLMQRDAGY